MHIATYHSDRVDSYLLSNVSISCCVQSISCCVQSMSCCVLSVSCSVALKNIVDDVRLIWKEKKDRYKAKWVEWEAVADEMALDELALNEHY
jgi:hypothetical protein